MPDLFSVIQERLFNIYIINIDRIRLIINALITIWSKIKIINITIRNLLAKVKVLSVNNFFQLHGVKTCKNN